MLALRELQAAFADQLAGRDRLDLLGLVSGESIPAASRIAVYRHHLGESLSAALAMTFPTVQALVGKAFFGRLARDFLAEFLPAQPVLAEYGADLPSFIPGYGPVCGLPYLADIARLDWALNVAFHAEPVGRLTIGELSAIAAEDMPSRRLALPAGSRLLESSYPLEEIWRASQPGAGEGRVELAAAGCALLVLPDTPSSFFTRLSEGEAGFVRALAAGSTLEAATGTAFAADTTFDLSKSFARLVHLGAFAALQ
jgi:hypothetical protein